MSCPVLRVVALAVSALALSSCSTGSPAIAYRPSPGANTAVATPRATRPAVSGPCRLAMGGTFHDVDAANGQQLDITFAAPSLSTRALAGYAAAPSRGYYLTLHATIVNKGAAPAPIDPLSFLVDAGGRLGIDVNSGNAPYSGASQQLDATAVDPGETLHAPVTYDVPGRHGTVRFVQNHQTACSWGF